MLYRRFGKTDLQMPVFSCGGMRYQQSWNDQDKFTADNQVIFVDIRAGHVACRSNEHGCAAQIGTGKVQRQHAAGSCVRHTQLVITTGILVAARSTKNALAVVSSFSGSYTIMLHSSYYYRGV